MRYLKNTIILGIIGFLCVGRAVITAQTAFPKIERTTKRILINKETSHSVKIIPIMSPAHKKLYELAITSVSFDGRTSGLLQLQLRGLNAIGEHNIDRFEPNILNPDRWGHGEGAWIFRPADLCSVNRTHAGYGATREFAMRQMLVRVIIRNVKENGDYSGIESMTVDITIRPYKTNRSRPLAPSIPTARPCTNRI